MSVAIDISSMTTVPAEPTEQSPDLGSDVDVGADIDVDVDVDVDVTWLDVCAVDDIVPDCGAPALLAGRQIAIVRLSDDRIFAVSNYDPFSEAFVIARGIVGDRAGCPKIASPIFKQSFDLRTGICLDDATVSLPTYPVRVRKGRIEVGIPK